MDQPFIIDQSIGEDRREGEEWREPVPLHIHPPAPLNQPSDKAQPGLEESRRGVVIIQYGNDEDTLE